MSSSLMIGQYIPTDSIVHRLDPRTKMMLIFVFVIVVFFANNVYSYAWLLLFGLTAALLTKIKLPFLLKGLRSIWFLIIFTFILHVFVSRDGEVFMTILNVPIYTGALVQGLRISVRLFLLVLLTSLLTLTTTPIEITDAIESLLHPLKKIKFPVHELALMMSISLRFIPTLIQETEKISKAQASRGVDFKNGKVKDRIKAVIPLLVPLFVSAFKRAEELAMAMESRGYRGGEGRTRLRALIFSKRDYVTICLFLFVITVMFYLRRF